MTNEASGAQPAEEAAASNPDLTEEENKVLSLLQAQSPMDLSVLKEQAGLSNKKWDKAIKGLMKVQLAKVEKTDQGLFVSVV